jgi:hypothetical protein
LPAARLPAQVFRSGDELAAGPGRLSGLAEITLPAGQRAQGFDARVSLLERRCLLRRVRQRGQRFARPPGCAKRTAYVDQRGFARSGR